MTTDSNNVLNYPICKHHDQLFKCKSQMTSVCLADDYMSVSMLTVQGTKPKAIVIKVTPQCLNT
jgi:hypothetical protein